MTDDGPSHAEADDASDDHDRRPDEGTNGDDGGGDRETDDARGRDDAERHDDEDDAGRTDDRDDARIGPARADADGTGEDAATAGETPSHGHDDRDHGGDSNVDAYGAGDTAAGSAKPDAGGETEHDGENETGGETDVDGANGIDEGEGADEPAVPADVRRYERFKKMDGATYERANGFLRDRTYITAREWAIARLCTDFRTETGVEMTKIGKNLPRLVPFMTDTYTPQAVNQARASFENKVRKAGATFLYGAMTDLFTAEELDDVMYEATEVAKFLLEVEGADLAVDAELAAEDRIQSVMREVHRQSAALRHDDVTCPHCGHEFEPSAEAGRGDDASTE